jgi:hypothetical protein
MRRDLCIFVALITALCCVEAALVSWADTPAPAEMLDATPVIPGKVEPTPELTGETVSPEERQAACTAAINKALERYECIIEVGMIVTAQGNQPIVQVVPKEAPK